MNTALLLEMVAEGAPDRPVVGSMTAGELLTKSRRAARWFRAQGAANIAYVGQNSEAVPICLFGAGLAGLPIAPVNYRLPDDQLHAILRRLEPNVVVVSDEDFESMRVRDDQFQFCMPISKFLELVDDPDYDGDDLPFVDPDEIAVLLFTSGTTGEPKAAVLRHRHLTSYILTSVEYLSAGDDEAQLVSVPPYHVAGISAVLSSLYSGRRIAYLPAFEPEAWVTTVRDQGVTQAMVVPTMLGRVLDVAADGDLASLRHLSYGGGRMPVDLIVRAMDALPGVNFVNAYGLTETSSTISVLTPEDHQDHSKLGSVGRPLPTLELEIRDAEGNPVGPGVMGEIHVRGEQVAGEYLGRSVLTDDGWFPTNDLGHLDEDGYLYLDGRQDDVIVRGGENLSPGEIEETLIAHPAISDACVVGVPDTEWGEAVAAVVVLDPGATADVDEIKEFVRERLRSTKTPEVIDVWDELPYNETGKLLRRVIRDELGAAR
jgi:acyl-CoA synthetase (AMP-forming)/AMP-acid ligase II